MFDLSPDESRPAEPEMLRTFFEHVRVYSDILPAPGFYERVCGRIQDIKGQSIWVPLIYSRFHWRLVTAFFALALGTLSYVLATGWGGNHSIFSANSQQRRDAVLTEIVTYSKPK